MQVPNNVPFQGDIVDIICFLDCSMVTILCLKIFVCVCILICFILVWNCVLFIGLRLRGHIHISTSLVPCKDICMSSWCSNRVFVDAKIVWYPLLQNYAIDSNPLVFMSWNIWHFCDVLGRLDISMSAVCVTSIILLLGHLTLIPGAHSSIFV